MRPVGLACALGRGGARFVVVGGAAGMLSLGIGRPRDLDIVVDETDLPELVSALAALRVPATVASPSWARQCRLDSDWGSLDVFVEDLPACQPFRLDGVTLMVVTA